MEVEASADLVGPIRFGPNLRSLRISFSGIGITKVDVFLSRYSLHHDVLVPYEQWCCGRLDECHLGVSRRIYGIEAAREK